VITTKKIILTSHKITAYSEDMNNNIADLVVKIAVREEPILETHNFENSRFSFTLKYRKEVIKKNFRRYLKYLMQNIYRSK
jgi:hypothetical protein